MSCAAMFEPRSVPDPGGRPWHAMRTRPAGNHYYFIIRQSFPNSQSVASRAPLTIQQCADTSCMRRQLSECRDRIRRNRSEFRDQRDFVFARLRGNPSPEELKDLTDFMHDCTAPLVGVRVAALYPSGSGGTRDAAAYEEDPNDPRCHGASLPEIFACVPQQGGCLSGIAAARRRDRIGSSSRRFPAGGRGMDWRPVGVDVGADTTASCAAKDSK